MRSPWRWMLVLAAVIGAGAPVRAEEPGATEPPPSLEYRPPRPVLPEPKAPKPAPPVTIFQEIIGSYGTLEGSFDGPVDVAWDSAGNFYALDAGNNRVQMFNSFGSFVLSFGARGHRETDAGEFDQPAAIAVDQGGSVYVLDAGNNRVQKFVWIEKESSDCPDCPARSDGKRIRRLKSWGGLGSRAGNFKSARDLTVSYAEDCNGKKGCLYVLDSGNERLQKFDLEGEYVGEWGGAFGATGGVFSGLASLCWSPERFGFVYLLSTGCLVQQFKLDGTLIKSWPGIAPDSGLCVPSRIEFDDRNDFVYVLDSGNGQLVRFNQDGLFRAALRGAAQQFSRPLGFALDASGENFLVADTGNDAVQKFTLR